MHPVVESRCAAVLAHEGRNVVMDVKQIGWETQQCDPPCHLTVSRHFALSVAFLCLAACSRAMFRRSVDIIDTMVCRTLKTAGGAHAYHGRWHRDCVVTCCVMHARQCIAICAVSLMALRRRPTELKISMAMKLSGIFPNKFLR